MAGGEVVVEFGCDEEGEERGRGGGRGGEGEGVVELGVDYWVCGGGGGRDGGGGFFG